MPRFRRSHLAAIALLLVGLTLTACTKEAKSQAADTPTAAAVASSSVATPSPASGSSSGAATSGIPAPARLWDAKAVWSVWGEASTAPYWTQYCGKVGPSFNPATSGGMGCVFQVMEAAGAGPEAIAFTREYGFFLSSFQEMGTVDYGIGAAPWYNMGRPTNQLLLNGIPAEYEVNAALLDAFNALSTPGGQSKAPGNTYADVLAKNAFASPDRAKLNPPTTVQNGLAYTFDVPLQTCRACAIEGYMPVQFIVTADGFVASNALQPFKAP